MRRFFQSRITSYAVVVLVGAVGWYSVMSAFDLVPEIPAPRNRFLWIASYLAQLGFAFWALYSASLLAAEIDAFAKRRAESGPWKPAHAIRHDGDHFAKWPGRVLVLWMVPILYALLAPMNS
jgi:hypothetical protein